MKLKERQIGVGTKRRRRCARCHRLIGTGNEVEYEGRYYGSECIHKVMDRINSRGVSE